MRKPTQVKDAQVNADAAPVPADATCHIVLDCDKLVLASTWRAETELDVDGDAALHGETDRELRLSAMGMSVPPRFDHGEEGTASQNALLGVATPVDSKEDEHAVLEKACTFGSEHSKGSILHGKVPAAYWCVTRRDLQEFRGAVKAAVASGEIRPTDMDNFDPADDGIGPNIHTVSAQFIAPVTRAAGEMSWALMKHPEGIQCDLFITHGWAEGIYEFIDKTCYSWPLGARAAYCCMLSNPQNLDIRALISSPLSSPFAQALFSAKYVLVVPNHACSIYSRMWCAYEAHLAYSNDKIIYTACLPPARLKRRVFGLLGLMAPGFLASIIVSRYWMHEVSRHELYLSFNHFSADGDRSLFERLVVFTRVLSILPPLLAQSRPRRHSGRVMTSVAFYISAVAASAFLGFATIQMINEWREAKAAAAAEGWMSFDDSDATWAYTFEWMSQTALALGFCIATCFALADKRARARAAEEALALRRGWNGRVQDAKCTEEDDKKHILGELERSGSTDDVNHAIRVLLESGMSTPTLRLAHARTGRLKEAGRLSWSALALCVVVSMHFPLDHLLISVPLHFERCPDYPRKAVDRYNYGDDWCTPPYAVGAVWISIVELLQTLMWIIMFLRLPSDKRGFAVAVMTKFCLWSLIFYVVRSESTKYINMTWCFWLGPLAIIMAVAGPGRVAGIPVLGPFVVNLMFAGTAIGLIAKLCLRVPFALRNVVFHRKR